MKKFSLYTSSLFSRGSEEDQVQQKGPLIFEGKRIITWLFPSGILQQTSITSVVWRKIKIEKADCRFCECTPIVYTSHDLLCNNHYGHQHPVLLQIL